MWPLIQRLSVADEDVNMSQNQLEPTTRAFFEELKGELAKQAKESNAKEEGDRQDGFVLDHVDEGWLEYKGMSMGFTYMSEPPRISFTIGPDGPFVGHPRVFKASLNGDQVKWLPQDEAELDKDVVFDKPADFASYAITLLSNRLHDRSPSIK